MKKLICLVAGAALLGACEQKTEVAEPPANTPRPLTAEESARMGSKPRRSSADTGSALSTSTNPAVSTEKKAEAAEPAAAATASGESLLKLDSAAAAPTP